MKANPGRKESAMAKTVNIPVTMFGPDGQKPGHDEIACEMPLTIFFNGAELLTTLCTPVDLDYLTAGILESEGLISGPADISSMKMSTDERSVYVESPVNIDLQEKAAFKPLIASGGGKGSSSYDLRRALKGMVESEVTISTDQIIALANDFLTHSSTYENTHGVHSAALSDSQKIILFQDDIGRHNALDKIFGECLVKEMPLNDGIILTSGRVSSEIILKIARRRVPVLISKASPTNQGVSLAKGIGITLVRVTRGGNIFVYSHPERISSGA